jgi:DNA-binding IclR family transcriptional regulator
MRKTAQPHGVAAVDRALAMLDAFTAERASLSLAEISAFTGLYKSTILRLMASLIRRRYVVQLEDGGYRLGAMLAHLGGIYHRSFRLEDHVLPVLRRLVDTTGESASFYVREGDKRLCLFRVDSPKWVRDHVPVGLLLPLAQGAAGKVLVSFANPNQAKVKLPIATVGALTADSAGLAAPVLGRNNVLMGALTLSGPKTRFTKQSQASMASGLIAAAIRLTGDLGGDARIVEANAGEPTAKRGIAAKSA